MVGIFIFPTKQFQQTNMEILIRLTQDVFELSMAHIKQTKVVVF